MPPDELATLCHLHLIDFYRQSILWVSGGVLHEEDGAMFYAAQSPFPGWANGVFRTVDALPAGQLLRRAVDFFEPRQRSFGIWVREGTDADADIAALAEAESLPVMMDGYPVMATESRVRAIAPKEVELRWAHTEADIATAFDIVIDSYADVGMTDRALAMHFAHPERALPPQVRWVLAFDGATAVSTAMCVLSHGIAGIYWVGTLASHRGRGLGEATTAAVTNVAFDLGARAVTLQASHMGAPIYSRMGFGNLYTYRVYGRKVGG